MTRRSRLWLALAALLLLSACAAREKMPRDNLWHPETDNAYTWQVTAHPRIFAEADENIWYLDKAEIGTGAVRIRLLTQEGYQ